MARPLDSIRILDLSNVLAGPFCAYQLALMGATVIKVEAPGEGDLARRLGADPAAAAAKMGVSFMAVNGGKQSITLNLKHPEGKVILRKLAREADALVENFRPGVMARLGVDHAVLRVDNPGLVYCAISGFGQDGPWSHRPAYDQIIQGLSGLMSVTGGKDSAPLRAGFPVADTIGGMSAAFAIAAALVRKVRTGEGAYIDVSMLEATLASMGWVVSNYLATGAPPEPMGNENFTAAPSGTFRTGGGLINIAANEQKQFVALCEAICMLALAADERFAAREARKRHRAALNALVEQGLSTADAATWEARLNDAGVPAGQVLSVPAVLASPQVADRGFIQGGEGGEGAYRAAAGAWRLDGSRPAAAAPPPALGADTATWLRKLGYDDAEIARLAQDGVT